MPRILICTLASVYAVYVNTPVLVSTVRTER